MKQHPAVLIATLGTEAQVVTSAIDLLTRQLVQLNKVVILHTTAPGTPIEDCLQRLSQALQEETYANLEKELLPFTCQDNQLLADIQTPADAQDCFRLMYRQVLQAKRAGSCVHLQIAGGRKLESIYGMLTAQILFDNEDHLWYLHSSGEFLSSKRLHPQPGDQVALVPIPVILWNSISPAFCRLERIDDPFAALQSVEALQIKERLEACRVFVLGSLTPAEERVVRLLVLHGLSDQEIGDQLCLSPRTIEQHLRSAYVKSGDHWELDNMTRTQLVSLLNLYYTAEIGGKPS
jgi:CRISPR-associated Csx14 family protein